MEKSYKFEEKKTKNDEKNRKNKVKAVIGGCFCGLINGLFGGGGGKREGTAIPVGQPVSKIYFNTNNTIEETNAILSQLTFVDLGFGSPMCLVYANTIDGDVGNYIAVSKYN